jgi:DNA-binding CsgD family transcriptional regulator
MSEKPERGHVKIVIDKRVLAIISAIDAVGKQIESAAIAHLSEYAKAQEDAIRELAEDVAAYADSPEGKKAERIQTSFDRLVAETFKHAGLEPPETVDDWIIYYNALLEPGERRFDDDVQLILTALRNRYGVPQSQASVQTPPSKANPKRHRKTAKRQRPLTQRQKQIAELVVQNNGDTQAVADKLGITRQAVEDANRIAKEKLTSAANVGGGKKPTSIDANSLDIGEREEGRTKRQRGKFNE